VTDVRSLTNEELVRYAIQQDRLTVLENELVHRLEALIEEREEFVFPEWARALIEPDEAVPDFLKD
jgi:flagellar motility protein MotE (MotC chaperone)